MTRVGVTGHQRLTDPSAWPWVSGELWRLLESVERPLLGLSSLAAGTDQIFADMVLKQGGALQVVVPFAEYRDVFERDEDRAGYDRLLALAQRVRVAPRAVSTNEAYLLAGKLIVDDSDLILAVSESRVDAGIGGTADIVEYATRNSVPIALIDPLRRVTRTTY